MPADFPTSCPSFSFFSVLFIFNSLLPQRFSLRKTHHKSREIREREERSKERRIWAVLPRKSESASASEARKHRRRRRDQTVEQDFPVLYSDSALTGSGAKNPAPPDSFLLS